MFEPIDTNGKILKFKEENGEFVPDKEIDIYSKLATDITEKDYMDFIRIIENHLQNGEEKERFNYLEIKIGSLLDLFTVCYNHWNGQKLKFDKLSFIQCCPTLCKQEFVTMECSIERYSPPYLYFHIPTDVLFNEDNWDEYFPHLTNTEISIEWPKFQTSCVIDAEKEITKKDYFDFIRLVHKKSNISFYEFKEKVRGFSVKLNKLGSRFIKAYNQWNNKEKATDNIIFSCTNPVVSNGESIVFFFENLKGFYHIPVNVLFDSSKWNDFFPKLAKYIS